LFDIANRTKPILKWAGGKSGLLNQLVSQFPVAAKRYFEPVFGGGAVFFALKENLPSFLNDANPELVNLYSVVHNAPEELMKQLDSLESHYSEEFYYELRSQLPTDAIALAARTVFLNKTGFNGLYRQNSKGLFNVPFGKRAVCPKLYEHENIMAASKKLSLAQFSNLDFEEHIAMAKQGDFVYCDPPYEPLSPTSSFNAYKANGFSQQDQVRLKTACELAANRGAFVAISNSSAAFIDELYSCAQRVDVSARRAINSKGSQRGNVSEFLFLMPNKVSALSQFKKTSYLLEHEFT
jgi:DNA adenine methylase